MKYHIYFIIINTFALMPSKGVAVLVLIPFHGPNATISEIKRFYLRPTGLLSLLINLFILC